MRLFCITAVLVFSQNTDPSLSRSPQNVSQTRDENTAEGARPSEERELLERVNEYGLLPEDAELIQRALKKLEGNIEPIVVDRNELDRIIENPEWVTEERIEQSINVGGTSKSEQITVSIPLLTFRLPFLLIPIFVLGLPLLVYYMVRSKNNRA